MSQYLQSSHIINTEDTHCENQSQLFIVTGLTDHRLSSGMKSGIIKWKKSSSASLHPFVKVIPQVIAKRSLRRGVLYSQVISVVYWWWIIDMGSLNIHSEWYIVSRDCQYANNWPRHTSLSIFLFFHMSIDRLFPAAAVWFGVKKIRSPVSKWFTVTLSPTTLSSLHTHGSPYSIVSSATCFRSCCSRATAQFPQLLVLQVPLWSLPICMAF